MIEFQYKKTKIACAFALLITCSNTANALSCDPALDGYCLQSGNADFSMDFEGNMYWTIDNITHVSTTDFLVDNQALVVEKGQNAGANLAPFSLFDYIGPVQAHDGSGNLSLTGMTIANQDWASIDLSIGLVGGATGSNSSTLTQTWTITNTSTTAVDLSMFAYTNVDLNGFFGSRPLDDEGALLPCSGADCPTGYKQWDSQYQMIANVTTNSPTNSPDNWEVLAAEIGTHNECGFLTDPTLLSDLCDKIYNGTNTLLPSTVAPGPGDLQMAAQWVRNLAVGESFSYTQTMAVSNVSPIPVPAAIWLFGSGLIGLAGIARRKKSA